MAEAELYTKHCFVVVVVVGFSALIPFVEYYAFNMISLWGEHSPKFTDFLTWKRGTLLMLLFLCLKENWLLKHSFTFKTHLN